MRYGAYSRSAIERILAIRAVPKTALDTLAEKEQQQLKSLLGDDPIRPRSGKDYQQLLDEQTSEAPNNEVGNAANKPSKKQEAENRGADGAETGPAQDSQETGDHDGRDDDSDDDDSDDDDFACAGVA